MRLYFFFETLPSFYELFFNYTGPHDDLISSRYTKNLKGLVSDFGKFTEMISVRSIKEYSSI